MMLWNGKIQYIFYTSLKRNSHGLLLFHSNDDISGLISELVSVVTSSLFAYGDWHSDLNNWIFTFLFFLPMQNGNIAIYITLLKIPVNDLSN